MMKPSILKMGCVNSSFDILMQNCVYMFFVLRSTLFSPVF